MIRIEAIFSGRVQGVGFRATVQEIARRYAVNGFVRNRSDGTVELIAEGAEPAIEAFLAEIRERFRRNLRGESCERRTVTGEFASFDVRWST